MPNTTITLNAETITKLKWLKNRVEFLLNGTELSWEEFFNFTILYALPTIARSLKDKVSAYSNSSIDDIVNILIGGYQAVEEMVKEAEEENLFEMK